MLYSKNTGGFYIKEIDANNIPDDVIEIDDEYYHSLLEDQSKGKLIYFDEKKKIPSSKNPASPSTSDLIKLQILQLESQQTPRRIREAVLGEDNGWLADIESKIAALREQI